MAYSEFTCKFKITRGATKQYKIVFGDGSDLSEAERIVLTVKENVTSTDEEIILQKDYSPELSDLASGMICFNFVPLDTKSVLPGSYLFDVQVIFDSENIIVPAVGEFNVYRNVWLRTNEGV